MKQVLIFGGTFDPPHLAHVDIPHEAMEHVGFDEVLYVPTFQSPLKQREHTSAKHRIAMLELALQDSPWASISTIEFDRGGLSYTIDTLQSLQLQHPDSEFRLLIGADQWAQFSAWKCADKILALAPPAIMPREGFECDHDQVLPIDLLPHSSSSIRELLSTGRPIEHIVAPKVAAYITKHNLYH